MGIESDLPKIFSDLFSVFEISDDCSPESISQWDSMGHLILISELQAVFGVSFTKDEVEEMVTIGAIKEKLLKHGVEN